MFRRCKLKVKQMHWGNAQLLKILQPLSLHGNLGRSKYSFLSTNCVLCGSLKMCLEEHQRSQTSVHAHSTQSAPPSADRKSLCLKMRERRMKVRRPVYYYFNSGWAPGLDPEEIMPGCMLKVSFPCSSAQTEISRSPACRTASESGH